VAVRRKRLLGIGALIGYAFSVSVGLLLVRMLSSRRLWLAWPVYRYLFSVPFVERVPVLVVSRVIQRFHQSLFSSTLI
jgi:hypothetical protein